MVGGCWGFRQSGAAPGVQSTQVLERLGTLWPVCHRGMSPWDVTGSRPAGGACRGWGQGRCPSRRGTCRTLGPAAPRPQRCSSPHLLLSLCPLTPRQGRPHCVWSQAVLGVPRALTAPAWCCPVSSMGTRACCLSRVPPAAGAHEGRARAPPGEVRAGLTQSRAGTCSFCSFWWPLGECCRAGGPLARPGRLPTVTGPSGSPAAHPAVLCPPLTTAGLEPHSLTRALRGTRPRARGSPVDLWPVPAALVADGPRGWSWGWAALFGGSAPCPPSMGTVKASVMGQPEQGPRGSLLGAPPPRDAGGRNRCLPQWKPKPALPSSASRS